MAAFGSADSAISTITHQRHDEPWTRAAAEFGHPDAPAAPTSPTTRYTDAVHKLLYKSVMTVYAVQIRDSVLWLMSWRMVYW